MSRSTKKENLLFCIVSTLISTFGILLILKSNGFYPFKEVTLFTFDMKEQYLPFFSSLHYLIGGDDSIFFHWSKSLGGNYIGLYAYYLASPFSWLTTLFSIEKLPLAIFLMTVSKISLSGLTFSVYVNFLWNKYNSLPAQTSSYRRLLAHLTLLPLPIAYALMSYNLQFALSIMWLDGVILLPLLLLGVEKLLDKQRNLWFILPLTAIFYFNYYISYMAGIFCALYLLFRLLTTYSHSRHDLWRILKNFALSTLISLGLAAPLLIPTFSDMFIGKLSDPLTSVVYDPRLINQPLSDILGQLRNGTVNYLGVTGLPNIYCGYLAILLSILFLFCKRISLRERIGAFLLTSFLLLSFYLWPLNIFWHGFITPNSFNYRYSFLFSFCLLYMSCRFLCVLSYQLPCFLEKTHRFPALELVVGLLLLITSADLGINGRAIFRNIDYATPYMRMDEYVSYLNDNKPLIDDIKASDSGMYRICQNYQLTSNDPMLLGFKGMFHYSSTYTQSVNALTSKLGIGQTWLWNTGYGTTPVTDSLWGVKYLLSDTAEPSGYYSLKTTDNSVSVYENPSAMEFIYSAPLASADISFTSDPFENQSRYLNNLCGSNTLFYQKYDIELANPAGSLPADLEYDPVSSWSYSFIAENTDPVYMYMPLTPFVSADIYVNDALAGSFEYGKSIYNLCLGCFHAGEAVTVTVVSASATAPGDTYIESLDTLALQDALTSLQTGEITLTSHSSGRLSGNISVHKGDTIVTSIPYDVGWHIRLDGHKVHASDIGTYADTFLTIQAPEGEHHLEMYYLSPGIVPGLLILLITLMLLLVVNFLQTHKKKQR